MDQEQRNAGNDEPLKEERKAASTGRREFLGKSFGAVPIVLTLGNRQGWGGKSIHGTLWSSNGTDWKHRGGRWWRGKRRGWEKDAPPPRFKRRDQPHPGPERDDDAPAPQRPDWEWQKPRDEWRKWRPEEVENQKPDWDWDRDEKEAPVAKDVPLSPIDDTIRKNKKE